MEENPNSEKTEMNSIASPTDPHAESDYDLSLDRESGLAIDAAEMGNEARFINDYRGVPAAGVGEERGERRRKGPNAEFRVYWDERGGGAGERGMGVWVVGGGRGIRKGEEILVSYGKGFWGEREAEVEK